MAALVICQWLSCTDRCHNHSVADCTAVPDPHASKQPWRSAKGAVSLQQQAIVYSKQCTDSQTPGPNIPFSYTYVRPRVPVGPVLSTVLRTLMLTGCLQSQPVKA